MKIEAPLGGTQILFKTLLSKLGDYDMSEINLILTTTDEKLLKKDKINILWIHIPPGMEGLENLCNRSYLDRISYFVFVSHWQYEKFRYFYKIPEYKSLVIRNATDPIERVKRDKKIKLIYTSRPGSGLNILLDAFERISREDVELDIYSSNIIYGEEYAKHADDFYAPLLKRAKTTLNVNYCGYAPNVDIKIALQKAHIFAYPSTQEETSCLAAIEAAMAGLDIVTTNFGALYETLGPWAKFVCYDSNLKNLTLKYAHALNLAIDNYWLESTQTRLHEQSIHFHKFWSWEQRTPEWKNFLSQLK